MYHSLFARISIRQFSSSLVTCKTTAEKVGEVADRLNKSVGRGLASAIETGEEATQKTKEAVGGVKKEAGKVAGKFGDMAGEQRDKVNEGVKSTKEKVEEATQKEGAGRRI